LPLRPQLVLVGVGDVGFEDVAGLQARVTVEEDRAVDLGRTGSAPQLAPLPEELHMAKTNPASPLPAPTRWPCLIVIVLAAIELMGGLIQLPTVLGGGSGPGLGGSVLAATTVLRPILALAALAFAFRGRMAYALLALAAIIAVTWLYFLPFVAQYGLRLNHADVVVPLLLYQIFLLPLIAFAVATLALARRFMAAAVLAALPTTVGVANGLAFLVSFAIAGVLG
jgi:hypothetical protein